MAWKVISTLPYHMAAALPPNLMSITMTIYKKVLK